MLARDVMTAEVVSVTEDMTPRQIARILIEKHISGVPVVDGTGNPVGMITESDLLAPDGKEDRTIRRDWWLAHLAEGEPLSADFLAELNQPQRTAREIMASPLLTVADNAELSEIAGLFASHHIKRMPVLKDGRMIGIVSRLDLVRQMSMVAPASTASSHDGFLAQAIAGMDERFMHPQPAASPAAKAAPAPEIAITAKGFASRVEEFGHLKAQRHDEARRAAAAQRKALVEQLLERHLGNKSWQDLLVQAQTAADAGEKELLLLRFPSELCSDGGRAVNVPLPEWPTTLRGEAAEIYLDWERDLKPNGFHLIAQVLDFPGGFPGDIGLTLVWGV